MPTYTWITEPPIVEVSLDAVESVVNFFQRSLEGIAIKPGEEPEESAAVREYGEFTATKARAAIDIAQGFKESFNTTFKRQIARNRHVFAYLLSGKPVGMIDISIRKNDVYIEHVVGHAGTENAGDILIEYIIQLSPADPPKVVLFAAGEQPFRAYRKIGFVAPNPQATSGAMELDLSKDEAKRYWTHISGKKYKLSSHIALGYMTSASKIADG